MSKKQYTETFANIHPSDESIERIMSMTNKKYGIGFRKALIITAVVVSVFCSVCLAANAATDGAVAESVSEVMEVVSNKITVLVNGKETEAEIKVDKKTNADGEEYEVAEVRVELSDAYIEYEIQAADGMDGCEKGAVIEDENGITCHITVS